MKRIKKMIILLITACLLSGVFAQTAMAFDWGYWEYNMKTVNGETYLYTKSGKKVAGSGWQKVRAYTYSGKLNGYHWVYLKSNGAMTEGWKKIGGSWYYFLTNGGQGNDGEFYGCMVCDGNRVRQIDGEYYAFRANGKMRTGWLKDGYTKKWYYLKPGSGKAARGWQKVGNSWYYFNNKCEMQTGTQWIDNSYYFFDSKGRWVEKTGWSQLDNNYYRGYNYSWTYLKNGYAQKGWKRIGNKWYYFSKYNGIMTQGRVSHEVGCYFNNKGVWVNKTGWQKIVYPINLPTEEWIYLKKGYAVKGWQTIGGKKYYFATNFMSDVTNNANNYRNRYGMLSGGTYVINGKKYTFNKNGVLIK